MCKQHNGLLYKGPSASAPRLQSTSCQATGAVDALCILTTEDVTFAGSLMQLPWPPTSFSQPYPWSSPQIIWKTSPLEDPRGPSPPQGYYSQTASSSLWGPKFLCGQMLLSKTGCAFWQCTHRVEIPICKSHVNLLNFSWKGGSVYDEIYLGSQAVQCANCEAVDVAGFRD